MQAGIIRPPPGVLASDLLIAFAANQRDEVRDLHDLSAALSAQQGMKQQTFIARECLTPWDTQQSRIFTPEGTAPTLASADGGGGRNPGGLVYTAGFSATAGSKAGSIGFQEEIAPTLKGTPSGGMMPSVLCLNDQGGGIMDCSEDVAGTLRAQEHGHQPLVFENHGIDARYKGPLSVAPTMSARMGTGGNNTGLVLQEPEVICISGNTIDRQPQNGGNGIGFQMELAYTLTATDHHAVFARQRVDRFQASNVASTESEHQHKDATDLILQPDDDAPAMLLIRRLIPLECELLQGYPPGWTDLPGASDSARYKSLGNSVAVPCVEYLMQGIALVLRAGL
jgi:DNA (cytosine-5)-methyltransferase 1